MSLWGQCTAWESDILNRFVEKVKQGIRDWGLAIGLQQHPSFSFAYPRAQSARTRKTVPTFDDGRQTMDDERSDHRPPSRHPGSNILWLDHVPAKLIRMPREFFRTRAEFDHVLADFVHICPELIGMPPEFVDTRAKFVHTRPELIGRRTHLVHTHPELIGRRAGFDHVRGEFARETGN